MDDYKQRNTRILLNEVVRQYTLSLEKAIDEAISFESDKRIRRNLLLFRINAIGAVEVAAFNLEPVPCLIDTWVLTVQLLDFLESSYGELYLGDGREIVLTEIRSALREVQDVFRRSLPDLPYGEADDFIQGYTAKHRVTDLYINRASPTELTAAIIAKDKKGVIPTINSMEFIAEDINFKMSYWSTQLPKNIRWQLDYMVSELAQREGLDSIPWSSIITDAHGAMNSLAGLSESMPGLIGGTADSVMAEVNTHMLTLTEVMARERRAFLAGMSAEREAAIRDLLASLEDWKVLIDDQRKAALTDLGTVSSQTVALTAGELNTLSDKMYRRSLVVVGILCATVLIAVLIYKLL